MKNLLLSCLFISVQLYSQTYRTINIDGTNDFNSTNEKFLSTSGDTISGYVTWDNTYLYIGLSGSTRSGSITDNERVYHFYLDTDPSSTSTSGSGTTDGEAWRWDPTLPFTANYHYAFKTTNELEFKRIYSSGTWKDSSFSTSNYEGSGFWELRIKLSEIGNSKQINLIGYVEEDWENGFIAGGIPSGLFTNTNTQGAITFNSFRENFFLIDQITPNHSFNLNNFQWLTRINASIGSLKDTTAYAGMALNATNGYDSGIDLPKPPTPPSNYVEVYFPRSGWSNAFGTNYQRDFKALTSLDSTTSTWTFSVSTDQNNSVCTLSVDNFDFIPSNYNIKIKDESNDSLHNIRTQGNYIYNTGSASRSTRNFSLIIGVSLSSPNIQSSVNSLSFGTIKTNKDSSKSFTVTNTGDSTLIITNITSSNSVFTFDGSTTDTLSTNEVRNISVKFAPTASANYTDSLQIFSNDSDTPILKISLTGTGQTLSPDIYASDSSLVFGSIKLTKDSTITFKLYNAGDTTLAVTNINTSNGDFTITSSSSFTINAGDSASVSVKFAPATASVYSDTLFVFNSDANSDTFIVTLSGTGVALQPNIAVSPSSMDFGNIKIDYDSTRTFTLSNNGETTLNITNILSGSGNFVLIGATSFSLEVDSSKTLSLKFKPTSAVNYNSTLTITSNDPDSANYVVNLSGTGTTGSYSKTFSAGWNLMSIPVNADDPLASAVMGDDFSSYFLYSYSNSGGYLNEDSLLVGHGYWLGLSSTDTLNVAGAPQVDTLKWSLANGWNIISNPFIRNYLSASVYFQKGSETLRADSAANRSWVQNVFYGYTNSSGSYYNEDTLTQWNGYWLSVLTDSAKIVFLHDSTVGSPIDKNKISPQLKIDSKNWAVKINGSVNDIKDELLFFGVSEFATDGFDPKFDLAEPPISPRSDAIQTYFYYPNWNPIVKFFSSDLRSPFEFPAVGKSWTFKTYSKSTGNFILSWNDIATQIPQSIKENYNFYLTGPQILLPMNMLEITEHSFTSQSGIENTFTINAISTTIEEEELTPKEFSLDQNFPNPFNPVTKIKFAIPEGRNVKVVLTVYNILGKVVEVLMNEERSSGYYEVTFNSQGYPSGTYIYELRAGEFTFRRKMLLLK